MWQRWVRSLSIQVHWARRDLIRRWRLDTPAGTMGILTVISGILLLCVILDGIAHVVRSFIPWVIGSRVGEVYWQSVTFGLKTSIMFLLFSGSLILFIVLKFSERR